ncbi:homogentisate 1,2-dioxygenase [Bailinhaonella thermotolerans]|uniref:Homogentisate 1,2-dioxygenase n=1 Tax=Bailinhaonella thermotolerans TaxID=1070861 RepID=A0A3A4AMN0_9ACTN|nr:homogentisate 1,2-dioxygenase [Bailinhaonella thermotolerans]RJL30936.1 homogentisate 1,2-dioxygenase [Bailinhaonella thermotolerans]
MPHYRVVGEVPRKRHVQFRRPDGGLYAEELMGEEGFSSDSSLLYHRHLPTAIVKSEAVEDTSAGRLAPNLPLSPRHFRTQDLPTGGDLVTGRQLLAGNGDVRMSYAAADAPNELYRNSMGDEVVYVQSGSARFESTYGAMDVGAGDYVVIPTGTIHRFVPIEGPVKALVIEASGHVRPPKRYLSKHGQFLEHAPYSERDLRAPSEPHLVEDGETPVLVRTRGGLTRLTYAHHPFDVVGWDGFLYPYAFNINDFEPIVKRTHAPPPVHQTFEGPNFVICSFCPRPLDFDAEAIPIPYNHHNVDSDELMFYVGGDYSARKGSGIDVGSISLHPAGFTHGPQPGAVEAVIEAVKQGHDRTTEMAVMVDTFRPLDLGPAALRTEDPDYAWTWAR